MITSAKTDNVESVDMIGSLKGLKVLTQIPSSLYEVSVADTPERDPKPAI